MGELVVMDQGRCWRDGGSGHVGHRSGREGWRDPGWARSEEEAGASRPGPSGAQLEAVWLACLLTPGAARPGVGCERLRPVLVLPCDPVREPLLSSPGRWFFCKMGRTVPAPRRPNEPAENWAKASGKGTGAIRSRRPWRAGLTFPASPGPSCASPGEHSANICRISEWISESRRTEISWTNTGLEEVYISV